MKKICFLAAALALAGCGYTNEVILPQGIQKIAVVTVKNEIPIETVFAYQPGLEMRITNAIIREFQADGTVDIVEPEEADAVLYGTLKRYEQEGVRFTDLEAVGEFRLFIVLGLELRNTETGEIIFKEENFSGDGAAFVSDVRSDGREEATDQAVDRLASNVVDRIVEDW